MDRHTRWEVVSGRIYELRLMIPKQSKLFSTAKLDILLFDNVYAGLD